MEIGRFIDDCGVRWLSFVTPPKWPTVRRPPVVGQPAAPPSQSSPDRASATSQHTHPLPPPRLRASQQTARDSEPGGAITKFFGCHAAASCRSHSRRVEAGPKSLSGYESTNCRINQSNRAIRRSQIRQQSVDQSIAESSMCRRAASRAPSIVVTTPSSCCS